MKMRLLQLLLLLVFPLSLPAQTLIKGRLFTSAEQRQYLDYLRQDFLAKSKQKSFNIEDSQIPDIPANAVNTTATPTEYSLDGIMKRADGRLTIWLNRKPLTELQLPANFRVVREGNAMALKVVTSDGRSQMLRPGQTIEITSGAVQERLHRIAPQADEKSAAGATTAPNASAATEVKAPEAAATPTVAAANSKTATSDSSNQSPQSAIESLPTEMRKDPAALDSMIKSLEVLKKGLDENKTQ